MDTEGDEVIEAIARPLAIPDELRPPVSLFQPMSPGQKLALATEVATIMRGVLDRGKTVIDANGNPKQVSLITRIPQKQDGKLIGYSEHVQVEGWQTLGMLCGATARIASTKRVEKGYEAIAEIVYNGTVIGAGESDCLHSESRWRNRDDYALKGMAQTRSISRAWRGVLGWVMVLAGYSATPAEEMPPEDQEEANDDEPADQPAPRRFDRSKARARIFAKAAEFARWSPDGEELRDKLADDDERHALIQKMYGVDGMGQMTPEMFADFERRLSSQIAKAKT